MTGFWIAAAVLAAIAVALVLLPLWREWRRGGRWSWVGCAAAVAIAPAAVALYFAVSRYDHAVAERVAQNLELVNNLAEHMRQNPGDARGWRLLGDAYMSLGQYLAARNAFAEALRRTPSPDSELKVDYAEATVLTDRGALTGEAGRLLEDVLRSEPANPGAEWYAKALWYGGMAAYELGRSDDAADRWSRLLQLNLPEQLRGVVERQLMAVGASPRGESAPPGAAAAGGEGPELRLRVSLGEGAATQDFGPNARVFLFARAPGGGPPLAARNMPISEVPGEWSLSDEHSMIPGRSLAAFDEVVVVARVSRSGQANAQAGDWEGEAVVATRGDGVVDLVIDRVVQ